MALCDIYNTDEMLACAYMHVRRVGYYENVPVAATAKLSVLRAFKSSLKVYTLSISYTSVVLSSK
jgi:hypothetical protein